MIATESPLLVKRTPAKWRISIYVPEHGEPLLVVPRMPYDLVVKTLRGALARVEATDPTGVLDVLGNMITTLKVD